MGQGGTFLVQPREEGKECPPTAGEKLLLGAGAFRGHTWCKPGKQGRCVPCPEPQPHAKVPSHEAWRPHRLPPVGRIRRKVAPSLAVAMARRRAGRRRRPLRAKHREPRPGARIVPRDPIRRGPRQSPPADRRRPGGRSCGAVEGSAVHPLPTRPRLLPLLLQERDGGGSGRRGDRRRAPRSRDRRELRPGPRRGQQPGQPGDRGPRFFRRSADRGRSRDRVREGFALPGDPAGRETFPGARRHVRRLPPRAAGRPGGTANAPSPRTAPLPPRRACGNPGAHDRARDVPGARPRPAGHLVPEDPSRPVAEAVAVPGSGHLRRAGDEGDRGSFRHGRSGGPRRDGRVRRRARLPGGRRTGGGDRPPDPGGYRPAGVPAGGGGGGGSIGAASGVGGGEGTLSAGAPGGGCGEASGTGVASAGALGKCRANISGR